MFTGAPPQFRKLVLFLGPGLLLVASLLHGGKEAGTVVDSLIAVRDTWLFVHILQLFAVALIGLLMFESIPHTDASLPAVLTRISAFVFSVFYIAADAVAGLGTSIILNIYAHIPDLDFVAVEGMLYALLESDTTRALFLVASSAWLISTLSLAIALYRSGGRQRLFECALLIAAGAALFVGHGYIYGSASAILLLAFVYLSTREAYK